MAVTVTSCEIESAETALTDPLTLRLTFHSESAELRTWKFLLVLDTVFAQEPILLGEAVTDGAIGNLEISSPPLENLAEYPAKLLDNLGVLEISCGSQIVQKFPASLTRKGGVWMRQFFLK